MMWFTWIPEIQQPLIGQLIAIILLILIGVLLGRPILWLYGYFAATTIMAYSVCIFPKFWIGYFASIFNVAFFLYTMIAVKRLHQHDMMAWHLLNQLQQAIGTFSYAAMLTAWWFTDFELFQSTQFHVGLFFGYTTIIGILATFIRSFEYPAEYPLLESIFLGAINGAQLAVVGYVVFPFDVIVIPMVVGIFFYEKTYPLESFVESIVTGPRRNRNIPAGVKNLGKFRASSWARPNEIEYAASPNRFIACSIHDFDGGHDPFFPHHSLTHAVEISVRDDDTLRMIIHEWSRLTKSTRQLHEWSCPFSAHWGPRAFESIGAIFVIWPFLHEQHLPGFTMAVNVYDKHYDNAASFQIELDHEDLVNDGIRCRGAVCNRLFSWEGAKKILRGWRLRFVVAYYRTDEMEQEYAPVLAECIYDLLIDGSTVIKVRHQDITAPLRPADRFLVSFPVRNRTAVGDEFELTMNNNIGTVFCFGYDFSTYRFHMYADRLQLLNGDRASAIFAQRTMQNFPLVLNDREGVYFGQDGSSTGANSNHAVYIENVGM